MKLSERIVKEKGLSNNDKYFFREKQKLIEYLKRDNLEAYLSNVVVDQYLDRTNTRYSFNVSDSLILLDSIYKSEVEQILHVKLKYLNALKKMLQSNDRTKYYAALDYIYNHLQIESNKEINLELDDINLYTLVKDSIKVNENFLKQISFGKGENYSNNLYGFAEEVERMFESKSR